jgi:hypothetical protein
MKPNTWGRRALAIAAVALLSVPSAIGVQRALEPTRGPVAAWLAAGGFELVYISTAILLLSAELRVYARRVALAAVGVAVLLNTLADYQTRTAVMQGETILRHGLTNWTTAQALFDPLALGLSIVESLPLAGLAYAMAELLHRLGDATPDAPAPPRAPRGRRWQLPGWLFKTPPRLAPVPVYRAETPESAPAASVVVAESPPARPEPSRTHRCKACGAEGLAFAELGRHSKTCPAKQQAVAAD